MPVAEVGKEYTYNGKRYVARKHKGRIPCMECALSTFGGCTKIMRDGLPYTCYDEKEENDVIFVEVENGKEKDPQ